MLLSFSIGCTDQSTQQEQTPPHSLDVTITPPTASPAIHDRQGLISAAEVSASSGPIEITLRIEKKTLSLGESFLYQLQLRNISESDILIAESIFGNPWELYDDLFFRHGIYFEIIGPDGAPLPPNKRIRTEPGTPSKPPPIPPSKDRESIRADISKWKAEGLSNSQINDRLLRYATHRPISGPVQLLPGESLISKPGGPDDGPNLSPAPGSSQGFSQLWQFDLMEPGSYSIRAIYNRLPSAEMRRTLNRIGATPRPTQVRIETPAIDFIITK